MSRPHALARRSAPPRRATASTWKVRVEPGQDRRGHRLFGGDVDVVDTRAQRRLDDRHGRVRERARAVDHRRHPGEGTVQGRGVVDRRVRSADGDRLQTVDP
jgi:hypothetical protein